MGRRTTGPLYRTIPEDQEELIASLTGLYAHRSIRFDSGFLGAVPVQCTGRIGRRFFYFRFRGDTASLTIGSADHQRFASQAKAARREALRKLRRDPDGKSFAAMLARSDLRKENSLDRHPSRAAWYAARYDVTGDRYAGTLEPEEAAELFIRLMDDLVLVPPSRSVGWYRATRRSSRTAPLEHTPGLIRKPSKNRR